MGNDIGSLTNKAKPRPCFYLFTSWTLKDVKEMLLRSSDKLSESFGLGKKEFFLLLGGLNGSQNADHRKIKICYEEIFSLFQTRKGLCDKFEVICSIILVSTIQSAMKANLIFDLFNFNSKGYLLSDEVNMLISTVTNAGHKIDSQLKLPSKSLVSYLTKIALEKYGLYGSKQSIRKPELQDFTKEISLIQSFMDAFRGHINQVSTTDNQIWVDIYFNAVETSITPSMEWSAVGLPPRGFTRWCRLQEVNTPHPTDDNNDNNVYQQPHNMGCTTLFCHIQTFSRDIMKQTPVYSGSGACARGYLKQGFLADRYLLNSLAVCLSQPEIIERIFTKTGQENIGRYNIKLFEGGGWRSLFIDDRIPCFTDKTPLFCSSSDPYEAWPLLVEKALAKYFGSYGHLALNGARYDNVLSTLRILTGGHVFKRSTLDMIWVTGDQNIPRMNGYCILKSALQEGSLVALGRSESLVLTGVRSSHKLVNELPFGRLFAIVSINEYNLDTPYHQVVLRDCWDVIVHDDGTQSVDLSSGHFRTFTIQLEDIPLCFDTLVVCRYPDVLRKSDGATDNEHLGNTKIKRNHGHNTPLHWKTHIECEKTNGLSQPALFKLIINNNDTSKNKEINDIYVTSSNDHGEDELLVDIALTVSSAVDWIIAGEQENGAKTRIRIIPYKDTLEFIRRRRIEEKERRKVLQQKRYEIEKMLESGQDDEILSASDDDSSSYSNNMMRRNSSQNNDNNGDDKENIEQSDSILKDKSNIMIDEIMPEKVDSFYDFEEYIFSDSYSWLSVDYLKLLPGEYLVAADVSFEVPLEDMVDSTLNPTVSNSDQNHMHGNVDSSSVINHELDETPWKENWSYNTSSVWLQVSSVGDVVVEKVDMTVMEAMRDSFNISIDSTLNEIIVVNIEQSTISGDGKSEKVEERTEGDSKVQDEMINMNVTSVDLNTIQTAIKVIEEFDHTKDMNNNIIPWSLENVTVPTTTSSPFMLEVQYDTSTCALHNKLNSLRSEAEVLASQFVDAVKRVRSAKKKLHLHQSLRTIE